MDNIITSAENKNVQRAVSLKSRKYRKEYGLYLIEGKRAVHDAITCGADIKSVFAAENTAEAAWAQNPGGSFPVFFVTRRVMDKICDTENPQDIAAEIAIKENALSAPAGNCLLLDRIQDPGNLGTIIRTAAACGIRDVYLTGGTDPYNPKAVRASMGGLNFVRVMSGNAEEIVAVIKKAGLTLLCADMDGENIFGFKPHNMHYALAVGSEADGIGNEIKSACDSVISLPMENIESLNAAVCASVMMYTLENKR